MTPARKSTLGAVRAIAVLAAGIVGWAWWEWLANGRHIC
jgi:hypothetical protein